MNNFVLSAVLISFFTFINNVIVFVASQTVILTKPIVSFCAGENHACAVFDNKKMKCWGLKMAWGLTDVDTDGLADVQGEIGSAIPYVDIGSNVGIEQVTCGSKHICMKLDTGNMKCLGGNGFGQIGIETNSNLIGASTGYIGDNLPSVNIGTGVNVTSISNGCFHSCVRTTDKKVKCFGLNLNGQLGLGDKTSRGTSSSQMGDNLPYIDFITGVEVASVHSGSASYHNCAIFSSPSTYAQRFKCWGRNDFYQLGYGDTNNRGDTSYEMGANLTMVYLGAESKVQQLTLGRDYTCALLLNNVLKCWGSRIEGQFGSGSSLTESSTGSSMPAITLDSGKTIKLMAVGYRHTCIVYDDYTTMKCFGRNPYGQLGQADKLQRGDTPTTMIPSIPAIQLGKQSTKISSIYCGWASTCAIFADNSIRCFGGNSYGELAIGSNNWVGDEVYEMGSNLTSSILFSPTNAPSLTPTNAPALTSTKSPALTSTLAPSKAPSNTISLKPTQSPTSKSNATIENSKINSMILCFVVSMMMSMMC